MRLINKIRWELNKISKGFSLAYDRVFKKIRIYKPRYKEIPKNLLAIDVTAWRGLEKILKDLILQSRCGTKKCLEFGVEFGYSTVALSNYFESVTGVDIFTGDPHAGFHGDIYEKVKKNLAPYSNITLIQSDYKDFIANNDNQYDLIHVDIIHTYAATFECGLWAARHSTCTLFHDTESFPEVKKAVVDIARLTGKTFYNYPYHDGLGILY